MDPGNHIRIEHADATDDGVCLPPPTEETVVAKLDGGYNVGTDPIDRTGSLIENEDTLPGAAMVKLMWTLAGGLTERSVPWR